MRPKKEREALEAAIPKLSATAASAEGDAAEAAKKKLEAAKKALKAVKEIEKFAERRQFRGSGAVGANDNA